MSLIFLDCEAVGGSPMTGRLTEFGAVAFDLWRHRDRLAEVVCSSTVPWAFHGVLLKTRPSPIPTLPEVLPDAEQDWLLGESYPSRQDRVFRAFADWLQTVSPTRRPIAVSDNPAFDWQWINCGFWTVLGRNPLGHSARRIGDYYAGLCGGFSKTQEWKRLRRTPHDHHPVHDALGNAEAFVRLLGGER